MTISNRIPQRRVPHQRLSNLILIGCTLACVRCAPTPDPIPAVTAPIALTASQAYAGEVLSYMLPVVLGQAGRPKMRPSWAARGLDVELDFQQITTAMLDSKAGQSRLMVLDTDIMGLSGVLYHYDAAMNEFKGHQGITSLYPSPELLAVRLLMLQKIHHGERIHLGALAARSGLLLDPQARPEGSDLHATNLKEPEFRLLQEVFEAQPHFFNYLQSPFLIQACLQGGVLERDAYAAALAAQANYRDVPCVPCGGPPPERAQAVVALLPSLTTMFEPVSPAGTRPVRFQPAAGYLAAIERLQEEIVTETAVLLDPLADDLRNDSHKQRRDRLQAELRKRISFQCVLDRPLTIHPGNVDRIVGQICPSAHFALILLGKNVYLSMDLESENRQTPAPGRLFLDLEEIKFGQSAGDSHTVARTIAPRFRSLRPGTS